MHRNLGLGSLIPGDLAVGGPNLGLSGSTLGDTVSGLASWGLALMHCTLRDSGDLGGLALDSIDLALSDGL